MILGEHSEHRRVQTEELVIHLQATVNDMGQPVWYAEALLKGESEQRCALRGPLRPDHESESLQIFMAELGKIIMERATFWRRRQGRSLPK